MPTITTEQTVYKVLIERSSPNISIEQTLHKVEIENNNSTVVVEPAINTVEIDRTETNLTVEVIQNTVEIQSVGVQGPPGELSTYAAIVDDSNYPLTYVGIALPGSDESSAVWQIKLINETIGLVVTFADGNANFDNIWDNRESLIYS